MKKDCFANIEGRCNCLNKQICAKSECPFYKAMTQEQKERFYKNLKKVLIEYR